VICTSVNDAVLHGLPHDYALRDGDLVTLDFAVAVDGWVADSAVSFIVGTPRDEDLASSTRRAPWMPRSALPPRRADRRHLARHRRGRARRRVPINTDFGGHGVGRTMHGDPHVPNDGKPGRGYPLRPGLVLALEPWFLQTTDELVTDPDGWTLRSADGSRARTPSTPSRSPPTGRSSSPIARSSASTEAAGARPPVGARSVRGEDPAVRAGALDLLLSPPVGDTAVMAREQRPERRSRATPRAS
jgi:methionine aminopeptidase